MPCLNTFGYCIGGMHLTIHLVIKLLYCRDASHNTLDYCIVGMHISIH